MASMAMGVVTHVRPDRAANLRETRLNREQLIEVIACGRPGTEIRTSTNTPMRTRTAMASRVKISAGLRWVQQALCRSPRMGSNRSGCVALGVLMSLAADDPVSAASIAALAQGLAELGWCLGQTRCAECWPIIKEFGIKPERRERRHWCARRAKI
jgi:hypothetical protein